MNKGTVEKLVGVEDDLCVSIILPTTRMPDRRSENEIRLNNLTAEAKKRLLKSSGSASRNIQKKLDQKTRALDASAFDSGLAIFVSDTISECIPLPFPVDERLAVNDRFLIKDLIYSLAESIDYYILVLSESKASLYRGHNREISRLEKFFPVEHEIAESSIERLVSSKPAGRWLGGEGKIEVGGEATATPGTYVPNMDSIEAERLMKFFREVDEHLEKRLKKEPLPVILATIARNAVTYKKVSKHTSSIVQELHGSLEGASMTELAEVVGPALEKYRKSRNECALGGLEKAIQKNLVASGFKECFYHASQGRAKTLLLERDTEIFGIELEGGDFCPLNEDGGKDDSVSDSEIINGVEELIRKTIAVSGEVVFLDKDSLKKHDRVAMILRY